MVDRAKILESVQIGLEVTEGTAVAAPTTIRSTSIETKIGGAAEFFRPDGRRFNTLSTLNQEWTTFALNGKGTYTELCYLLPMMFGNPSPTNTGVAVKTRTYTMSDTAYLSPVTATIMKGGSVRAQKLAGALLTDLTMMYSRKSGVTFTGSGIGRLFTDAITMTGSPSDVTLVPIIGKQLDCYIDATAANLGVTKLTRAFSLEMAMTGVYGPVWAINSAETSYGGHVDLGPATSVKFTLEADSTGMAYLTQFRAGTLMFIRVQGTGADVESSFPYSIKHDVCINIKTAEPDTDEDGVTTVVYEGELIQDTTWTKSMQLAITNGIASVA